MIEYYICNYYLYHITIILFNIIIRLTDSTSTSGSTSIVEPIKRVEPTKEAKVAGQAALARLEAKECNTKRFNT